jgi:hypothetical protein
MERRVLGVFTHFFEKKKKKSELFKLSNVRPNFK